MNYRLFHIGALNIYSYGVMVALAFITGIYLASKRAKQLNEDPQNILDLCLFIIIFSIIGARLTFVLTYWQYFQNNLIKIFYLQEGGLVFYGGMIFAVVTAVIFLKIKKLNIFKYLDILAPSLAFGHALGRIGCFLNGCCYGKIVWNDHLSCLGVKFPKVVELIKNADGSFVNEIIGSPPFLDHLHEGLVGAEAHESLPIYPTQLFSSGYNFMIFLFLMYLFKKRSFNGQIWWSYVFVYSICRFTVEFIRGDNPAILLGLTFSQILSVFMFILSLIFYLKLSAKKSIKRLPEKNA